MQNASLRKPSAITAKPSIARTHAMCRSKSHHLRTEEQVTQRLLHFPDLLYQSHSGSDFIGYIVASGGVWSTLELLFKRQEWPFDEVVGEKHYRNCNHKKG